ncbi:unnamed protein product, partial [Ectocarpus sp. 8 AP-2014]
STLNFIFSGLFAWTEDALIGLFRVARAPSGVSTEPSLNQHDLTSICITTWRGRRPGNVSRELDTAHQGAVGLANQRSTARSKTPRGKLGLQKEGIRTEVLSNPAA